MINAKSLDPCIKLCTITDSYLIGSSLYSSGESRANNSLRWLLRSQGPRPRTISFDLVSFTWEEVDASIQLGNQFGSEAFWQLNQDQRQKELSDFRVILW